MSSVDDEQDSVLFSTTNGYESMDEENDGSNNLQVGEVYSVVCYII
jgi:hypothetical protein